jgi:hypothetical protein
MTAPRPMGPDTRLDPDFAADVLGDLYRYRRKRLWLAWLLWGTLGLLGAHRFYLDRPGTGLLMLFTGGGGMVWWVVDAFLLPSMVREQVREQARREEEGLPPAELGFMPALDPEVLSRPPEWVSEWAEADVVRRRLRLFGDVAVLGFSGIAVAVLAKEGGVWEAVFAVLLLAAFASSGDALGRRAGTPVLGTLLRWSHRLRLFYHFNRPGSPPALLLRSFTATLTAPFQPRARTEVRLYLQLGAVFTMLFILIDFGGVLLSLATGGGMPAMVELMETWFSGAVMNFVVIYAFAAPIGAVITFHLLVSRTHRIPRILSGITAGVLLTALIVV